jgi:hypothetical protein
MAPWRRTSSRSLCDNDVELHRTSGPRLSGSPGGGLAQGPMVGSQSTGVSVIGAAMTGSLRLALTWER